MTGIPKKPIIPIPKKPAGKCYVCGSNDWWYRPPRETAGPGAWLCNRCHPNPNPGPARKEAVKAPEVPGNARKVVQSSNPMSYSAEVLALRGRVILGNKKLNVAWDKICQVDSESQEWKDLVEQWHQANERLSVLCTQLQGIGYEDCLYLDDNGLKTLSCLQQGGPGCRVCPSKIHYWEQEFDELDRGERGK